MKTEPYDDSDQDVKRAYRLHSTETVPKELNRAVLREAKAAVHQPFLSRIYSWRRPLAFAATLVLGVTLVYDMQTVLRETDTPYIPFSTTDGSTEQLSGDVQLENPTDDASTGSAPKSLDVLRDRSAVQQYRAKPASSDADRSQERKASQLNDRNAAAAKILEENAKPPSARFEALSRDSMSAPASAKQAPASEANSACNETRYESAAVWWRCVQELRAKGDDAAADAERRQLETHYPDFRIP